MDLSCMSLQASIQLFCKKFANIVISKWIYEFILSIIW